MSVCLSHHRFTHPFLPKHHLRICFQSGFSYFSFDRYVLFAISSFSCRENLAESATRARPSDAFRIGFQRGEYAPAKSDTCAITQSVHLRRAFRPRSFGHMLRDNFYGLVNVPLQYSLPLSSAYSMHEHKVLDDMRSSDSGMENIESELMREFTSDAVGETMELSAQDFAWVTWPHGEGSEEASVAPVIRKYAGWLGGPPVWTWNEMLQKHCQREEGEASRVNCCNEAQNTLQRNIDCPELWLQAVPPRI
jgi:hypothetical protein